MRVSEKLDDGQDDADCGYGDGAESNRHAPLEVGELTMDDRGLLAKARVGALLLLG